MATTPEIFDDSNSVSNAPPSADSVQCQKLTAILSRIRDIVSAPEFIPSSVATIVSACAVAPQLKSYLTSCKLPILSVTQLYTGRFCVWDIDCCQPDEGAVYEGDGLGENQLDGQWRIGLSLSQHNFPARPEAVLVIKAHTKPGCAPPLQELRMKYDKTIKLVPEGLVRSQDVLVVFTISILRSRWLRRSQVYTGALNVIIFFLVAERLADVRYVSGRHRHFACKAGDDIKIVRAAQ
ncbi:hypothetical protein DFH29DRAFT_869916 [Suillus ampliporus]|nr:hypothetical protein DFH29DRAFT_869916 [Suillus ampliporus]